MARIYEMPAAALHAVRGRMRLIASVTRRLAVDTILGHLDEPTTASGLAGAGGPRCGIGPLSWSPQANPTPRLELSHDE
ncbi:MAG TPA: hypothetical protein VMT29_22925 [Steroidobacteraceae bacterium]|nr:hypothetical protein [Steroidobacteraceae bacterium]